jgi:hypothetical protein
VWEQRREPKGFLPPLCCPFSCSRESWASPSLFAQFIHSFFHILLICACQVKLSWQKNCLKSETEFFLFPFCVIFSLRMKKRKKSLEEVDESCNWNSRVDYESQKKLLWIYEFSKGLICNK